MVNPVRLDPDDDGPIPSEWDPEHWWTFGEAADLAGVTHRELAEWASGGQLIVRAGWREGAEIRLVRAGDVARLAPCVVERASRPRAGLGERAVFTGPRRSAIGKGANVASTRRVATSVDVSMDPEELGWVKELEREVDRVREELDEMRNHRDELLSELVTLRPDAAHGGQTIIEDDRLRIVHGVTDPSRPFLRRMRGSLQLVVIAAALIVGVALGRRSVAGDQQVVEASGPVDRLVVKEDLVQPVSGPGVSTSGPMFAVTGFPATGSPATGSPVTGSPTTEPANPEGAQATFEPDTIADGEPAVPDVEPHRASRLRLTLPVRLLAIEPALQVAARDVPRCALDLVLRADPETRRALGPCLGPLTADGTAVAGKHRVKGTACCSHHAFVERVASGVSRPERLAALLAEAAQAERDGLVPPLLALRAERSAVSFLRAGIGTWAASGLDGSRTPAAIGLAHQWTLAAGTEGVETLTLELTSWVCIADGDAPQAFHLVLDVDGAPTGDVLRSFDWLAR